MMRAMKCAEASPTRGTDTKPAPARNPFAHIQRAAGNQAILRAMSGAPLPRELRSSFESYFRTPLDHVRVHTGTEAAESAASLNAHAYTVGHDIVFGADEYRPHTEEGRGLLAHELTHVTQHNDGLIRRKMKLSDPAEPAPLPEKASRARVLQTWLDDLCSPGAFVVDPSTGSVTAARKSICRTTQKTGCKCLCEATSTAPGSKDIEIQIDEQLRQFGEPDSEGFAMEKEPIDIAEKGGGATVYPTESSAIVGMRPGISRDFEGVGDTSPEQPHAGWRRQLIRMPDWLKFGHELCGHALLQTDPSTASHRITPEGNRSAVDVENQLRRDHSTVTNSLGIRLGGFYAERVQGWPKIWLQGAVFRVKAGDTLTVIAERVGIPPASMFDHIYRSDGTRITEATQDEIAPGEELWIEDISWHTVIEGETVESIAVMWNVTTASLKRANPQLDDPKFVLRPGKTRLLIPAVS